VSARIGIAVVMARLLRGKREAERTTIPPPPASKPPMTSLPPTALESRQMPPAAPAGNAHRETDALGLIDDEEAEAPPEPETVAEPVRRHRCGYPVGSIGCRNTCGDGAG
jgi:hypothetical protein